MPNCKNKGKIKGAKNQTNGGKNTRPKEGRIVKGKGNHGKKDIFKLKCYKYGKKGHFARDCIDP